MPPLELCRRKVFVLESIPDLTGVGGKTGDEDFYKRFGLEVAQDNIASSTWHNSVISRERRASSDHRINQASESRRVCERNSS